MLRFHLDIPTQNYGYYQGILVFAYFLGCLFSSRIISHVGTEKLLQIGYLTSALGGIALIVTVMAGQLTPVTLSICSTLFSFGLAMTFATGPLRAMDVAPTATGVAAALLGMLEMLGGAAGSGLVTLLHDGSPWALAIVMGLASLFAAAFYGVTRPWRAT